MKIEYDDIYKQWVVWLIEGNTMTEIFKSDTKKDCVSFMKGKKKNEKRKRTTKIKNTK